MTRPPPRPKPLTEQEKQAYRQHVHDKTRPQRIRAFADWSLRLLFALGVVALIAFGGFQLWTLMVAKDKAGVLEQRLQDQIRESQRDAEQ